MNIIYMISGICHGKIIHSIALFIVILMCLFLFLFSLYFYNKMKKLYRRLNLKQDLFDTIVSNIDDVFIIFNYIKKEFEYISPNFEKFSGISVDDLMQNYYTLVNKVPLKIRDQMLNLLSPSHISNMKVFEYDYYDSKIGERHWILIKVYPVFYSDQLIRYVVCITDQTKEKLSQNELEEALSNLKKANEAKKEFLSHISHELKTPINAIMGMSQIAEKSIKDSDKVKSCLKAINYSSGKLISMINNVLDLSKIDKDKLVLENNNFSLTNLIEQLSAMIIPQINANEQIFSYIIKEIQHDNLLGDDMRLNQIIGNCISNSYKFTPSSGKIKLEVSEIESTDDKALISFVISDTGKGMSPEFVKRLFIPFEQEDSSISKKYGGTGLGLSITNSLVRLMGGNINITSELNVGTVVTIEIPFLINKESAYLTKVLEDMNTQLEYDCSGKRVLVVEDNEINREITVEFLKFVNINVETASDGYEAIKLFSASEEGYYDVILMDLIMPELDGYETAKTIRNSKHPDAKKVLIVAMTADNFAENQKSIECGMNYHITKPFNMNTFYSLLQEAITKDKIACDQR